MMGAAKTKPNIKGEEVAKVDLWPDASVEIENFDEELSESDESDFEVCEAEPSGRARRTYDYLFKIMFIGDIATGKSTLLNRYVLDIFGATETDQPNCALDFKIRKVTMDEKRIKLQIWDISGSDAFTTMRMTYYRGAMGIFIIYDSHNEDTFNKLPRWIREVKENAPENVKLTLLGNKCDLRERLIQKDTSKDVNYSDAKLFADEHRIPLFEVSAKDGRNVEVAVAHMVARILKSVKKNY